MILPNVWIKAAKIFKPNSLKDTGKADSIFECEGIVFSKFIVYCTVEYSHHFFS